MRVDVSKDYGAFLNAKLMPGVEFTSDGFAILPNWDHTTKDIADQLAQNAPHLHEYQRFATTFAVARKRAALFLECGLGKTSIALSWIESVARGPSMICAPLAAQHEFVNEAAKFFPDVNLRIIGTADVDAWIANPEGIALVTHHAFIQRRDLAGLSAFVLDESSILKSGEGAIARSLVASCQSLDYRLALSATPAPNDPTEYATHATFLGYMRTDAEFRAKFFVRDGKEWRVKGHAVRELPKWLSRFALWMSDPAAYGMPCDALPAEDFSVEYIDVNTANQLDYERDLFGAACGAVDMSLRSKIRGALYKDEARGSAVVESCKGHRTIVWAIRNAHADQLEKDIREGGMNVGQIAGTTPDDKRVEIIRQFQAGELDVIVSKASVIGHGVNLQQADNMVFAGYDESYEAMHQAIRRAHRQGREGTLSVSVIRTTEELPVIATLNRKARQWKIDARRQQAEFVAALEGDINAYKTGQPMTTVTDETEYMDPVETDHYRMIHGDSIAKMADMEESSVDLSVFSPPFASLFTYSSESADMGNCSEHAEEEFAIHFAHFARALLRVMKPGRVVALHLAQLIAFRARHGRKGLRDFRGKVIDSMEDEGFHFYGEFVIPKNPQAVAIRTKSERLQFSQFKRDSLESSPALNDYVLEFRKPGKQAVKVLNDVSNEEWINWASGVWTDINETDVLTHRAARSEEDEKHICPLQLSVIERIVRLWSNEGETVFTPFAGIGSEVYTAICQKRFGVGIELKAEYFKQAVNNSDGAVAITHDQLKMALKA